MSYANTLPQKTGIQTSSKPLPVDPALRATKPAFFFLLVFTALLFSRPGDMIPALSLVHLAQPVAILICLAYVVAQLSGRAPFRWSRELKLMLGLTTLFIMGVPLAFWRGGSLEVLTQQWLKTLLIFFLLTQTVFSLARIRKLLWVIILCLLVVSIVSIYTGQASAERGERALGATVGFLSGNFFGIGVATMLPYIAVFLIQSRSVLKSGILIATSLLSVWMAILTASRGGVLCLLLSFALTWLLVLRGSLRARAMRLVFSVVLLGMFAAAPAALWERSRTLWDPSGYATTDEAMESEYHRKALFWRSVEYTFRFPVFGVGLGNFEVASGTFTGRAKEWRGTHNTYTQISSEAGIPAFLLFVWLLYTAIRNARGIGKSCANDPARSDLRMYAQATRASLYAFLLGGIFAHLAYDFYLYYLIGIGVALQNEVQRSAAEPALQ